MKIKTTITGGLAIDCRTNVYFVKDEVLEVGSKSSAIFRGLSEDDLIELVSLGQAEEVLTEEVKVEELLTEEVEPEYMSFTKKSDLEDYAKEVYGIDLDKRLTLKGMIEQLEDTLGGDL
jgi:hypothetical protein